jgi:hypothetical protein
MQNIIDTCLDDESLLYSIKGKYRIIFTFVCYLSCVLTFYAIYFVLFRSILTTNIIVQSYGAVIMSRLTLLKWANQYDNSCQPQLIFDVDVEYLLTDQFSAPKQVETVAP